MYTYSLQEMVLVLKSDEYARISTLIETAYLTKDNIINQNVIFPFYLQMLYRLFRKPKLIQKYSNGLVLIYWNPSKMQLDLQTYMDKLDSLWTEDEADSIDETTRNIIILRSKYMRMVIKELLELLQNPNFFKLTTIVSTSPHDLTVSNHGNLEGTEDLYSLDVSCKLMFDVGDQDE